MKQDYSSKEEIFQKAKTIVYRDGLQNLSMRKLASECYLALGTLYHYYPSKEDLVVLIMEDFWNQNFNEFISETGSSDFISTFEKFYDLANKSYKMFEKSFAKKRVDGAKTLLLKGKAREEDFIKMLCDYLVKAALRDERVKKEVFDDKFTIDEFVSTVMNILLLSLVNNDNKKEFLTTLITKMMY